MILRRHSVLWLIDFYGILGEAVMINKGKVIFNY